MKELGISTLSIYLCCFTPDILSHEGALFGYLYHNKTVTKEDALEQLKEYLPDFEAYTANIKAQLNLLSDSDKNKLYQELHFTIYSTTKLFDLPGDRNYVRFRFQELFENQEDFNKDL